MEEHSDVHEFIPWAHIDRRTPTVGLLAMVVAVAAIGVGVWISWDQAPEVVPSPSSIASVSLKEPQEPALLSEKDLQAFDVTEARMVAEEFVVRYFTRQGERPTYVEWARAGSVTGEQAVAVKVRYSLFSGDPLRRQGVREATVSVEMEDGVWRVLGLPVDRQAIEIDHDVSETGVVNEFGFEVAP